MLKILMSSVICFLLLILVSCHKPDNNPCKGAMKTSADFKTEEYWPGLDSASNIYFENDTFCVPNVIFFTAYQNLDSYQWSIGSDPTVHNQKRFSLQFNYPYGNINLQLIGLNRNPNRICFPNDNGKDTVKKKIFLMSWDKWPLFGSYTGTFDDSPNVFHTISIEYFKYNPLDKDSFIVLNHITSGKNGWYSILDRNTYWFTIDDGASLSPGQMIAHGNLLKNRKTLVFDIRQYVGFDPKTQTAIIKHRTFTGTKN